VKLTEKVATTNHKVLVYGAPKTGKTELVGRLAEHYNINLFDCEDGWKTLTKLPTAWQERINIVSVPDSRVYPIAAETWLKIIKGEPGTVCNDHGKWNCPLCKKNGAPITEVHLNATPRNTINVFDSLTQFTNSCISHITKAMPDDYKLQLDDWGALRVLIDRFLSQVQAARYNVVCITHEEEVGFEDGKKRLVASSGSSNSSRNTAKYFDDVIYCEVKNKKHMFGSSTTFGMNMVTGSRTGVEIEKQTDPTLLDIFTEWRQGMEEPVPYVAPVLSTTISSSAGNPGSNALANLAAMAKKGSIS
jgi:hypothetical protein